MIDLLRFPWGHDKPYNDYSSYFKKKFENRVQKIAVNAGFSCPNRDGTKAYGGCTYCNNNTFNPFYCNPSKTITQQINEGIAFFEKKYKTQKYLVYFQAFSNTYGDIEYLKKIWDEALSHPKVIGMVVGTRPDCVDIQIINLLKNYLEKFYVVLEIGIETTLNRTLELINRCHTHSDSELAIKMANENGIEVGVHMIMGLPEESRQEMLMHATKISKLPITSLKLHHLQIIKGTELEKQYSQNPEKFELFSVDEYIDFVIEFLKRINPRIIIERFISESPVDLLIAPKWQGLKNFEIIHRIEKKMIMTNSWQGKDYREE